jgi:hypothetical protein
MAPFQQMMPSASEWDAGTVSLALPHRNYQSGGLRSTAVEPGHAYVGRLHHRLTGLNSYRLTSLHLQCEGALQHIHGDGEKVGVENRALAGRDRRRQNLHLLPFAPRHALQEFTKNKVRLFGPPLRRAESRDDVDKFFELLKSLEVTILDVPADYSQ